MGHPQRLTGEYTRVLDERFRVVVPAPWRKALDEHGNGGGILMCNPGLEGTTLQFRTRECFDRWVSALAKKDPTGRLSGVQLSLMSHTRQVEVDSRGSITLPEVLVKLVALHRDVVWLGEGDHMVLRNR